MGSALLRRRRLHIDCHDRRHDLSQEREISPQRLIHYRDNWYFAAWCHRARGLRSFAVDAIRSARVLVKTAVDVPDAELDEMLRTGYGIFAGRRVQWARLRFSAERARWVSAESWHPKQRAQFEPEGSYLLELPYADPRELDNGHPAPCAGGGGAGAGGVAGRGAAKASLGTAKIRLQGHAMSLLTLTMRYIPKTSTDGPRSFSLVARPRQSHPSSFMTRNTKHG